MDNSFLQKNWKENEGTIVKDNEVGNSRLEVSLASILFHVHTNLKS